MAMKVSLGGQASGSGAHTGTWATDNAMFLKVFAGEVSTAFAEANVMLPLTRVRTISSGRSAQFPITGKAAAKYHTPGESLILDQDAGTTDYLSTMKTNEKLVKIDDLLTASCFIDSLDEAKSHYDYRGPFSQELGRALSYELDKNIIRAMYQSAGGSASDPILAGMGNVDLGATTKAAVTSAGMIGAFFEAAEKMDANDLPEEGRFAVVGPELYYRLIQKAGTLGNAINLDYSGSGSVATGKVMEVAGIKVYKSNHVDDVGVNYTVAAGNQNQASVDYSLYAGVFGHEEAVATVKLKDIALESDYMVERQGTLFVAKMALGTAPLRQDAAGYFKLAV